MTRASEQRGEIPTLQATPPKHPAASKASARPRDVDGRYLPLHGAAALEKAYQRGKLPRWARRLQNRKRFELALGKGFPSWASTPSLLRTALDNVIRNQLLCERYFAPFWKGEDVSPRYLTASENLRRCVADLGLDSSLAGPSLNEHLQRRYAAKERVE